MKTGSLDSVRQGVFSSCVFIWRVDSGALLPAAHGPAWISLSSFRFDAWQGYVKIGKGRWQQ